MTRSRPSGPAPHLVPLDGGWALWRWTWVRGTGFPARLVRDLASTELAHACDALEPVEDERLALRREALAQARPLLKTDERKLADKVIRALVRDVVPPEAATPAALQAVVSRLRELDDVRTARRAALATAFERARAQSAEALRSLAADPRFREAVLWQNRASLEFGLDWLLQHPDTNNKSARAKQHVTLSYLQRYCVKNDTIGFFGPIGWGRLTDGDALDVRPGPALVATRAVDFEHWAIDALAAAAPGWRDLRPHVAPRLLPSVAVDGARVRFGFDSSRELPPAFARLLAACDGETPAIAIAEALRADPDLELASADEVYELLDQLVERKLVVWRLEPSALDRPEEALRALLMRIPDAATRAAALAPLERLDAARREVAAAAGDVPRLDRALAELERVFEAETGRAATRRGGETYAARTPVYEDCVRDLDATIGSPVLARLAPVFTLVGQAARWFTHALAARYRDALRARFAELAARTSGPVRYLPFWRAVQELFPERREPGSIPLAVEDELARRWAEVLRLDLAQARVTLTAEELRPRIAAQFTAPGPGWPGARYVAPDVLVAAPSVEAIARGEATLVLGEVHLGNTMLARLIVPHQPDAEDGLIRAYEHDIPEPRVMPAEARDRITRADALAWSAKDLDLELGSSRSWRPRANVLRAADLVVEETATSLVVRDEPSGRTFDVIALLEAYLTFLVIGSFRPMPHAPHVPRITVDGVVIAREQWRLTPEDLPVVDDGAPPELAFLTVRSWARARGLPRYVFVKVVEEPKPVFVDFDGPLFVEILAKLLRRTAGVTISEMLPDLDHAWLPDAAGERYLCELRMVAVDPLPWCDPGHETARRHP